MCESEQHELLRHGTWQWVRYGRGAVGRSGADRVAVGVIQKDGNVRNAAQCQSSGAIVTVSPSKSFDQMIWQDRRDPA